MKYLIHLCTEVEFLLDLRLGKWFDGGHSHTLLLHSVFLLLRKPLKMNSVNSFRKTKRLLQNIRAFTSDLVMKKIKKSPNLGKKHFHNIRHLEL